MVPTIAFSPPADARGQCPVLTPRASSLSDARRHDRQGDRPQSTARQVARGPPSFVEADLLYNRWLLLRKGKRTTTCSTREQLTVPSGTAPDYISNEFVFHAPTSSEWKRRGR